MARAGTHLARVITPERRLDAAAVCRRLEGMRLLTLATVTADGRPLAAPVDGIFYRGAFHFGTAPDAVRLRHVRARPDVSATHLDGETFAVTVHGRAGIIDIGARSTPNCARSSSGFTGRSTDRTGRSSWTHRCTRGSTRAGCLSLQCSTVDVRPLPERRFGCLRIGQAVGAGPGIRRGAPGPLDRRSRYGLEARSDRGAGVGR